jgi:hypothetical protein
VFGSSNKIVWWKTLLLSHNLNKKNFIKSHCINSEASL